MYNSKKWVPVQPWWYVIMCAGLQVPTESTTATGIKGTGPIFIFYTPPFIDATSWMGFPGGSDDKESACSAWEAGSIPGSRRSPGVGNGNPLQYSCLENPRDRGAWWATVHRVTKSWTRLSNYTAATATVHWFHLFTDFIAWFTWKINVKQEILKVRWTINTKGWTFI